MRFSTGDIEGAVDVLDGETDGVPVPIGLEFEATALLTQPLPRVPVPRARLASGTTQPTRLDRDLNGVPSAVEHEDADVCVGLWCAA